MNVLSIQSRVTYGYVGNSAAMLPLQRLGFDVWPIDTVSFSNHLGYKTWRGRVRAPEEIREIVDGLELIGKLPACDAVLSGYLGDAATGEVVLDAVARVRRANPRALYACDPVMGDRIGGLYVRPGIPEVFAGRLIPAADIVMPNEFELSHLTDGDCSTLESTLAAVDRLRATGADGRPRLVVVTGLDRREGAEERIEVLAVDDVGAWLIATPRLAFTAYGTGDTFAALFLGHYLRRGRVDEALARAVAAMYAVVEATAAAGSVELKLVAAQDRFHPSGPVPQPRRVR